MPYLITIDNTGEMFRCKEDMHVLEAMERAMCRGIPVGCRNGGCGACKVRITVGDYVTRKMNRAVVNATEELQGYALACSVRASRGRQRRAPGRADAGDGAQVSSQPNRRRSRWH